MHSKSIIQSLLYLVCLVLFYGSFVTNAHTDVTIDAVTLLLPVHICSQKLAPVQHKVRAHGGCFRWYSSSPHIISVTSSPTDSNTLGLRTCITPDGITGLMEAYVGVVHDETLDNNSSYQRQSAWVWAEDLVTGRRAEFEVFVDKIDKIIIGTSTRRINVGDTESLDIQAFDEHGDIFSTVEGLPFEWTNSAEHISRRLTFSEANMNVSSTRLAIEKMGFGTDRLPIQGVIPGRSVYNVRLLCNILNNDISTSVEMLITEPLGIYPTLTRICPSTDAQLKIFTRQLKTHLGSVDQSVSDVVGGIETIEGHRVMKMPQPQYKWYSDNSTVVKVDLDVGTFMALTPGYTKVAINDVTLGERSTAADIVVVEPHYLDLMVYRSNTKVTTNKPYLGSKDYPSSSLISKLAKNGMETDEHYAIHDVSTNPLPKCNNSYHLLNVKTYTVKVHVFDKNDRVIDICGGIEVTLSSKSQSQGVKIIKDKHVYEKNGKLYSNGWITISTSAVGLAELEVKLATITTNDGGSTYNIDNVLSKKITIVVNNPLQAPTNILLPTPPTPISHNQINTQCAPTITVNGGSSYFSWSSLNKNTLAIIPSLSNTSPNQYSADLSSQSYSHTSRILPLNDVGTTDVYIRDRCNADLSLTMPVETSVPSQLCTMPVSNELIVDNEVSLMYVAKDTTGRQFFNDSCLTVNIHVGEGKSLIVTSPTSTTKSTTVCNYNSPYNSTITPKSCFTTTIRAINPGFSRIEASLVGYSSSIHSDTKNSDSMAVAAYNKGSNGPFKQYVPISTQTFSVSRPLSVEHETITAAVGTPVSLNWFNGPLPWPCHKDGFTSPPLTYGSCQISDNTIRAHPMLTADRETILNRSNNDLYQLTPAITTTATVIGKNGNDNKMVTITKSPEDIYSFTMTCLDVSSDITVRISIANTACPSNPWPVPMYKDIKVTCVPAICASKRKMVLTIGTSESVSLTQVNHPLKKNLIYVSDDSSIATVNEEGVVTAVGLGVTIIHVFSHQDAVAKLPWGVNGLHDIFIVHSVYQGFHIQGLSNVYQGQHATLSVVSSLNQHTQTSNNTSVDKTFQLISVNWASLSPSNNNVVLLPLSSSPPSDDETVQSNNWPAVPENSIVVTSGPSVRLSPGTASGSHQIIARVNVLYPPPSAHILDLLYNTKSTTCPVHDKIVSTGETVQHSVSTTITVLPKLALTSPQSILIPPASTMQISTTMDNSIDYSLFYNVFNEVSKGVTVGPRGWLSTDSNVESASVPVLVSAKNLKKSDSEPEQHTSVHVEIQTPHILDVLPVVSPKSPLSSDFTLPARTYISHDNGQPTLSQPLCAINTRASAISLLPNIKANQSLLSSVDKLYHASVPTPSVSQNNITLDVFARDANGRKFDSLSALNRDGILTITNDRPDLIVVTPLSLNSGFSLSSSTTTGNFSSFATTLSPSILTSINIKALKSLDTAQRATVSIYASTPYWNVQPIHIQIDVASLSVCSSSYSTPLSMRLVVPINKSMIQSLVTGSTSASIGKDSRVPISNSVYLSDSATDTDSAVIDSILGQTTDTPNYYSISSRRGEVVSRVQDAVVDMISLAIDDVIYAKIKQLKLDKNEVSIHTPTFKTFVRAVDVFAGVALVDAIPIYSPSHYTQQPVSSIPISETLSRTSIPQPNNWDLRGSSQNYDKTNVDIDVSTTDVSSVLIRRFNVTLPVKQRSAVAANLVDVDVVSPNIAIVPDAPYFPYRSQRDAYIATVLDITTPLIMRNVEMSMPFTSLAAASILTSSPSTSIISAIKNRQGNYQVTAHPILNKSIQSFWPFSSSPLVHWTWVYEETVLSIMCMANEAPSSHVGSFHHTVIPVSIYTSVSAAANFHGDVCRAVHNSISDAPSVVWSDALKLSRAIAGRSYRSSATVRESRTSHTPKQTTSIPVIVEKEGEYSKIFVFTLCALIVGLFVFLRSLQSHPVTPPPPATIEMKTVEAPVFYDYDSQRENNF